jgi:hypothetical protein
MAALFRRPTIGATRVPLLKTFLQLLAVKGFTNHKAQPGEARMSDLAVPTD